MDLESDGGRKEDGIWFGVWEIARLFSRCENLEG